MTKYRIWFLHSVWRLSTRFELSVHCIIFLFVRTRIDTWSCYVKLLTNDVISDVTIASSDQLSRRLMHMWYRQQSIVTSLTERKHNERTVEPICEYRLYIVIYGFIMSCKNSIMHALSWRTVYALTRRSFNIYFISCFATQSLWISLNFQDIFVQLGSLLLICFNFDPSMDKQLYVQSSVQWNSLSISRFRWLHLNPNQSKTHRHSTRKFRLSLKYFVR